MGKAEEPDPSEQHEKPSKYLSCAYCIWQVTKQKLRKLCCCCCISSDSSSRQFQWMLFKQNARVTIAYYLVFLAFGMCIGFFGPILEDLACITGAPVKTISWAIFAQTCTMVIGILASGVISKWLSADFLLLLSMTLLPICLLVISFTKWLPLLAGMMALMGLAMGAIDCLANLQLVHIYDKAVAPFLQAMHFCYGFGALLSPLIADWFILNEDCSALILYNQTLASQNASVQSGEIMTEPSIDVTSFSHLNTTDINVIKEQSRVHQAFWILAGIQVPIVFFMSAVVIKEGFRVRSVNPNFKKLLNQERKPILKAPSEKDNINATEMKSKSSNIEEYLDEFKGSFSISFTKALLLTSAACVMVFIYDGLQGHVNDYIDTYAVKNLRAKGSAKEDMGLLNVYFWASYSLGRLISVALALKFTPYFMLLLNVVGSQIAVLIFLGSLNGSYLATVGGCVLLGLSMSSVTPTTISMTEHFMDMTSIQMSLIIGGAAVGEMVIPLIAGQLIDEDPSTFVILMMVLITCSWIVYAVFWFLGRVTEKYKAVASPSFIWYNPHQFDLEAPSSETSFTHSSSDSSYSATKESLHPKTFTEYSPTNADTGLDESIIGKDETENPRNSINYSY